jgi:hypothetical protein
VPRFFRDDAYEVSREARHTFPNHTFFIAGAARSGTPLHVDPNQTGAWNSLLCGRKRWVLFPPGIAAEAAEAAGLSQEHYKSKTTPPTKWWREHYPRLKAPDEARRVGMVRPRPARFSPSAAPCAVVAGLQRSGQHAADARAGEKDTFDDTERQNGNKSAQSAGETRWSAFRRLGRRSLSQRGGGTRC